MLPRTWPRNPTHSSLACMGLPGVISSDCTLSKMRRGASPRRTRAQTRPRMQTGMVRWDRATMTNDSTWPDLRQSDLKTMGTKKSLRLRSTKSLVLNPASTNSANAPGNGKSIRYDVTAACALRAEMLPPHPQRSGGEIETTLHRTTLALERRIPPRSR